MSIYYTRLLIICQFSLIINIPLAMAGNGGTAFAGVRPGCETQCGDVTVPFPFGIAKGNDTSCSLNKSFLLTCRTPSDGTTPGLYLGSNRNVIRNISDSELRIMTWSIGVAYRNYNPDGSINASVSAWSMLEDDRFTFSEKNKLTVVGCDDYSLMTGRSLKAPTMEDDFSSGCITSCINNQSGIAKDRKCSGKGCCEISIPKGLRDWRLQLESFRNHTGVWSFNQFGVAILGEEGTFEFRGASDLADGTEFWRRTWDTVPVVVDWVVEPNKSCSSEVTECKGKYSECYDDVDGGGYRCRCKQGYQGNPYLDNNSGCQDINECEDPGTYPCYGDCINTPGGYYCTCPSGSHGNATREAGCVGSNRIIYILGALLGTGLVFVGTGMKNLVAQMSDKKLREKRFKRNGGLLLQQQTSTGQDAIERIKMFSARELEAATDRYNDNRVVGRGGQGTVYKGMLPDGKIVAVKKSVSVDDETQIESFINEVFLLSQISHRNVVKLLGCCLETEVPVLVYEFVSNGNLFQFLHDENYEFPTLWSIRITIATEVAGALAYMHNATSVPIYHRDIKSSNILLDEKFRAKLSDFGISKSVIGDETHLSTVVKGTYGYLDPEYFQSNQFTEKSDVYSFGIVLVELLTGKKPIFSAGPGESRSLATLILSMEEGLILENIDERVSDGPKEQLMAVAMLAKRCLNLNGKLRPTMKDVATELEGIRSSCH